MTKRQFTARRQLAFRWKHRTCRALNLYWLNSLRLDPLGNRTGPKFKLPEGRRRSCNENLPFWCNTGHIRLDAAVIMVYQYEASALKRHSRATVQIIHVAFYLSF